MFQLEELGDAHEIRIRWSHKTSRLIHDGIYWTYDAMAEPDD